MSITPDLHREITVYSTPACGQCMATKRHLSRLGLEFAAVDLSMDEAAMAYVKSLGHSAAPVVVVRSLDGEDHWDGYDPAKLDALA